MRRRSRWTCTLENGWEVGRGRNVTGGSLDLVRDMTTVQNVGGNVGLHLEHVVYIFTVNI